MEVCYLYNFSRTFPLFDPLLEFEKRPLDKIKTGEDHDSAQGTEKVSS